MLLPILTPAINYITEYHFDKQLILQILIDHHLISAYGQALSRKGMKRNFWVKWA